MGEHKTGNTFKDAKNKVGGNKRILAPEAPPIVEEVKPEPKPEPKSEPKPQPVAEEPIKNENLLAGMKIEKKPDSKSFGYYLDVEVDEALGKLAKQNKSTKSKVLNTLLRHVLMGE